MSGCQFTIVDNNGTGPAMSHVMASYMEQEAFMCKGCGLTFLMRVRVHSHIRNEHVEKGTKSIRNVHEKLSDVKCPECAFVSKDYMEVRNH